MNWISRFFKVELVNVSERLQFFIPSHTKKRYSPPRARVYRGMPLAGGRNNAASNIGNIDRQTSFRTVRRLDNSRRKCRGNGEGLIKKYLQSSIITRKTRRVLERARARACVRERKRGGENGMRTGDGKAPVRSCQVSSTCPFHCCVSFCLSPAFLLFLRFLLFRVPHRPTAPCRPRGYE